MQYNIIIYNNIFNIKTPERMIFLLFIHTLFLKIHIYNTCSIIFSNLL